MHTHEAHAQEAPERLRWAVITVSDSRRTENDDSGHLLVERLTHAKHEVLEQLIIPDDIAEIRGTITMVARDPEIDAIITNGGTGPSARDVTIEATAPLIGKVLPGFGELFRQFSYEQIGASAYLSRAQAATLPAPDAVKILFQLPGSPEACELGVTDLIIPVAGHFFHQANRGLDVAARFRERGAEKEDDEGDDDSDDDTSDDDTSDDDTSDDDTSDETSDDTDDEEDDEEDEKA